MYTADNFLNEEQEQAIVEAIRKAEKKTSGEIRVHLAETESKHPLEDAEAVFLKLGMEKTALRNGVLIHINVKSRELAIVGDRGINDVVPNGFWNEILQQLTHDFKQEEYTNGIIKAVDSAGDALRKYFPYDSDDINELPNTISKE